MRETHMMQFGRGNRTLIKRVGPVAWAGALALFALTSLTAGVARAEDDENSFWNFDQKVLNGLFGGLGPRHTVDGPYVYRERPPLVVPSSRALPPPVSLEATRPANWPVDADVGRSKTAAVKRAKARSDDFEYDPLPPGQLRGTGGASSGTQNPPAGGDMTDTLRPSQLGTPSGGIFSFFTGSGTNANANANANANTNNGQQDRQASAAEPPPRRLIEPPREYQTPSPNQPYGAGAPIYKPNKAMDLPVGNSEGL
jgi:hypothetical protein